MVANSAVKLYLRGHFFTMPFCSQTPPTMHSLIRKPYVAIIASNVDTNEALSHVNLVLVQTIAG